jgi:hypothetical protein
MGFQPFFRKPQLHRPCSPPPHLSTARHERSTNFFMDKLRQQDRPKATPAPAATASMPMHAPLLPLASHLITVLLIFINFTILLALVMVR